MCVGSCVGGGGVCFDRMWKNWEHIPATCALLRWLPLSAAYLVENVSNSSEIFSEVKIKRKC